MFITWMYEGVKQRIECFPEDRDMLLTALSKFDGKVEQEPRRRRAERYAQEQPKKRYISVAIKVLDWTVTDNVEIGDKVVVMLGGQPVECPVVDVYNSPKAGISYKPVEEVIRK